MTVHIGDALSPALKAWIHDQVTDVPGEDAMVAHAQAVPQHDVHASRAMYADAQIGPTDLTRLEPKDIAVPAPWPDEEVAS